MNFIKVIQRNVSKWTPIRRNELFNTYMRANPNIIMINSTGLRDLEILKTYTH